MKQFFKVCAMALLSLSALPYQAMAAEQAEEKPIGLTFSVGADAVSQYLWRGMYCGGMGVQPSVELGWKGLYVNGWWYVGSDNWTFQNLAKEMDLSIGFNRWGVNIGFIHYYYFDGEKFLDKNVDMTLEENASRSCLDGFFEFHLGDLVESVPLSIVWQTRLWGGDGYMENDQLKRAYSTYIEAGYDFTLPLKLQLGAKVGFTPWKSSYTGYEDVWKGKGTVGITNLQLDLSREFDLKFVSITPYLTMMMNCYGISWENFRTSLADMANQRFNFCVGASIFFDNEW